MHRNCRCCSMWWASDGPGAPHTPQSISLTTARCLRSLGLSRLFIFFLNSRFSQTGGLAAAMGFPLVVRQKPKLHIQVFRLNLPHYFAVDIHHKPVSATMAAQIKNWRLLVALFTSHAAFIAPRSTAALKSWGWLNCDSRMPSSWPLATIPAQVSCHSLPWTTPGRVTFNSSSHRS